MKMKGLLIAMLVWGSYACAQVQTQDAVHVFPVQGNVYMIVGPGGNTTVQVGKEGIVVVDTQTAAAAPQVMATLRTISAAPIVWVINTSMDADHMGGNEALIRLGGSADASERARVVTHENVLDRFVKL